MSMKSNIRTKGHLFEVITVNQAGIIYEKKDKLLLELSMYITNKSWEMQILEDFFCRWTISAHNEKHSYKKN